MSDEKGRRASLGIAGLLLTSLLFSLAPPATAQGACVPLTDWAVDDAGDTWAIPDLTAVNGAFDQLAFRIGETGAACEQMVFEFVVGDSLLIDVEIISFTHIVELTESEGETPDIQVAFTYTERTLAGLGLLVEPYFDLYVDGARFSTNPNVGGDGVSSTWDGGTLTGIADKSLLAGLPGWEGFVATGGPLLDLNPDAPVTLQDLDPVYVTDTMSSTTPYLVGVGFGDSGATDSDGDGLPDDWENDNFGNLDQGPDDDPDGDGCSNLNEYEVGTDPNNPDTDGDGVNDCDELDQGTDPLDNSDSDGDGLPDDWEIFHFGDITSQDGAGDPDADGCDNLCEWTNGTDPNVADTDGGGVNDGDEIGNGTDPLDPSDDGGIVDTDGDGLPDDWEIDNFGDLDQNATDDPDMDGCDNLCEFNNGTDPNNPDTDGDGINDGDEINDGTDPLDPNDPGSNGDSDGDGLPDDWELGNFGDLDEDGNGDPDDDGCDNLCEFQNGTDPNDPDSDNDGLTDGDEITIHNTDPNDANTDNDADNDGDEVACGSNPLSAAEDCSDVNGSGTDWQSPLGDLGYIVLSSILMTAVIAISLIGLFGRWS